MSGAPESSSHGPAAASTPLVEFGQALPVSRGPRQAPWVIGKGQLGTDHNADPNAA